MDDEKSNWGFLKSSSITLFFAFSDSFNAPNHYEFSKEKQKENPASQRQFS